MQVIQIVDHEHRRTGRRLRKHRLLRVEHDVLDQVVLGDGVAELAAERPQPLVRRRQPRLVQGRAGVTDRRDPGDDLVIGRIEQE